MGYLDQAAESDYTGNVGLRTWQTEQVIGSMFVVWKGRKGGMFGGNQLVEKKLPLRNILLDEPRS